MADGLISGNISQIAMQTTMNRMGKLRIQV